MTLLGLKARLGLCTEKGCINRTKYDLFVCLDHYYLRKFGFTHRQIDCTCEVTDGESCRKHGRVML